MDLHFVLNYQNQYYHQVDISTSWVDTLILFEVEDPHWIFETLVKQGVLIRNVTSYPMLSRALRVSIGQREENDQFLEALSQSLKEPAAARRS